MNLKQPSGKLILLSGDLMLGARVEGAVRKLGLTMATVGNQETAISTLAEGEARVLVLDLRLPNLQVGTLVDNVRTGHGNSVHIVACGPHVHEAKLAAAREAGCDAVVTRGQLDREAEAIIERLLDAKT